MLPSSNHDEYHLARSLFHTRTKIDHNGYVNARYVHLPPSFLPQACIDRVANKGFGTCEPWFFDYISCVDKCVSTNLYMRL